MVIEKIKKTFRFDVYQASVYHIRRCQGSYMILHSGKHDEKLRFQQGFVLKVFLNPKK